MQEVQKDPSRPILIRVETKAGHGAGKPTSKVIEERADMLAFALRALNAEPEPAKGSNP
jgi:prolyl oligopeptidase